MSLEGGFYILSSLVDLEWLDLNRNPSMNAPDHLLASLTEPLHEVATYYEQMIQTGQAQFWQLSGKGWIFDHYSRTDFVAMFAQKVHDVIEQRRTLVKGHPHTTLSGRLLRYAIHVTMFDCLAEGFAPDFIDSDDCPPPELWVGWDADHAELICFVPDPYINENLMDAVEFSMALTWQAGIVTVATARIDITSVFPN